MGRFNLDQKVSQGISFSFILVLACVVAWYSLAAGQEIVKNAKASELFSIQERINVGVEKQKRIDTSEKK